MNANRCYAWTWRRAVCGLAARLRHHGLQLTGSTGDRSASDRLFFGCTMNLDELDALTGIGNRRFFDESIAAERPAASRAGASLAVEV